MARPPAKELTERELEVMHVFWNGGVSTVAEVRDRLAESGLDRAYTTIATLVRILTEKGFLIQTNVERPFLYQPAQTYEDVSRKLLGEVVDRVFRGSRELLLVRLMERGKPLRQRAARTQGHLAEGGRCDVNDLGILLLQAITHTTAFLLLGIALYELLRRFGPAVGASAAFAALVVVIGVTALSLSPWPRWGLPSLPSLAPMSSQKAKEGSSRSLTVQGEAPAVQATEARLPASPKAISKDEARSPTAWIELLRQVFVIEPTVQPTNRAWSWPAWFALFVLATLGLGLARLGFGLWGMKSLRSRGSRIEDNELIDLVEILRAEMRCLRPVQLYEVVGLATPATVGRRRPIVLLPDDWRTWDESELQAVLAHELAHVCRNDYLAGLLAQFSLTLHFYHPLAHWLAARFRLEQELAADAWSSGLAGGKTSYLMTLARLALKRDRGATSWPVRAFLPSRGTFVRRIEMLRDTQSIRHVPITWRFRAVAFGTLVGLGLLVAGLRTPIGEATALAQAPEAKKAAPVAVPLPPKIPFDLAFPLHVTAPSNKPLSLALVPAEANVVLAFKPAELLAYPEFKEAFDKVREMKSFKDTLIVPPEEIDQLVVFATLSATKNPTNASPTFGYGIILRTERGQDWPVVVGRLIKQPESVRHEGETYTRWTSHPWELSAYSPDEKTLVLAGQEVIRMMIEDHEAPAPRHAWDEVWPKVEKSQVALAMETRWLRGFLSDYRTSKSGRDQLPFGFTFETVSPLFEKARGYALGASVSPGFSLDIEAVCGTEPNAKSVAETAQAILTLGRNYEKSIDRDLPATPKNEREVMRWLVKTFGSILERAVITPSGRTLSLQSTTDLDLAHWPKFLTPVIADSQKNRMRLDSVKNLKQIGLAFHTYHDKHNHFPPPVLYGGKSGKVPYSWRVAILPELGRADLYSLYNFDEPWDGPSNRSLLDKMPPIYAYPDFAGNMSSATDPSYYVLTGPQTALSEPQYEDFGDGRGFGGRGGDRPREALGGGRGDRLNQLKDGSVTTPRRKFASIADITDGTSNTLLIVEAKRDIPWTKPHDIPVEQGEKPLPAFGGYAPNGFNALFCDGSVRFLKTSTDLKVLRALITRDGGEVVSADSF